MKAIPITKKRCTATNKYSSPAKLAPLAAIAVKAAPAIIGALGKGKEKKSEGGEQKPQQQPAPAEKKNPLFFE